MIYIIATMIASSFADENELINANISQPIVIILQIQAAICNFFIRAAAIKRTAAKAYNAPTMIADKMPETRRLRMIITSREIPITISIEIMNNMFDIFLPLMRPPLAINQNQ
jgi:hypothetical protein